MGRYYCSRCNRHLEDGPVCVCGQDNSFAESLLPPASSKEKSTRKIKPLHLAILLLWLWNYIQGCQLREHHWRLKDLEEKSLNPPLEKESP